MHIHAEDLNELSFGQTINGSLPLLVNLLLGSVPPFILHPFYPLSNWVLYKNTLKGDFLLFLQFKFLRSLYLVLRSLIIQI